MILNYIYIYRKLCCFIWNKFKIAVNNYNFKSKFEIVIGDYNYQIQNHNNLLWF